MPKQMNIIECGTKVTTVLGGIEGVITGVTIRFAAVQYEISYFVNSDYKQAWVNECEFSTAGAVKNKIGFIK